VAAYLEVSRGASVERYPLPAEDQFTIGRHPASDLVLTDQSVSRVHAVIHHLGSGWCVSDVSADGTTVNGTRILGRRMTIDSGTTLVVGKTSIRLREYDWQVDVADESDLPATPPSVTPAEQRVLEALCRPLATSGPVRAPASVAQIADRLDANYQTVKFHLRNLYAKFEIPEAGSDRRGLLADAAVRCGLVILTDIGGPPG